jgi:galactokinase
LTDDQHRASFVDRYGRDPALQAIAPGRINLIGEHTDYNNGFVLPIVTSQQTHLLVAPREDRTVRMWSADVTAAQSHATYELDDEDHTGTWIDYVAGVTVALRNAGLFVRGFDGSVMSSLPLGAGLSSSA